jgi:hypothetical protein
MTRDEIIKMAWDSGAYTHRLTMWGFSLEDLERFAKLVAAKRTWVGLTDEETERLIHNFGSDPHTLLDEVDARLKARNT